jgi:hypothetical protein
MLFLQITENWKSTEMVVRMADWKKIYAMKAEREKRSNENKEN